jgi:hypothetical protein
VIAVGARKAALALAAMHPRDRDWMLERLPVSQRRVLNTLIDEARKLGNIDPSLVKTLLSDIPASDVVEVPPPDQLIRALDRLPNAWAARMLAAAAPDHAEVYLASCGPSRARAVQAELDQLPPTMPAALAKALSRRLADSQTLSPPGGYSP